MRFAGACKLSRILFITMDSALLTSATQEGEIYFLMESVDIILYFLLRLRLLLFLDLFFLHRRLPPLLVLTGCLSLPYLQRLLLLLLLLIRLLLLPRLGHEGGVILSRII